MKNSRQERRRQQEDAAFRKMIIWLVVAIVYEALVFFLDHYYVTIVVERLALVVAIDTVLRVIQWVGPVLTVLSVLWWVLWSKKGKKVWPCQVAFGVALALWVTAVTVLRLGSSGTALLSVAIPCVAALALIYYLYQVEFCANAALSGLVILCMWGYRKYFFNHPNATRLAFALMALVLVGAAVCAVLLSRGGGKLGKLTLMPPKTRYFPTYITCVLGVAALAVALLLGSTVAYYLIFVMVAWLFCMAVYYTVRMM